MSRPPKANQGKPVTNSPAGFPYFSVGRKPRIVTADPWSFLRQLAIAKLAGTADSAIAYLQQGHEFFDAAQNPRLNTRPLLYYYSFLNVVKAALLIHGTRLPPAAKHGISDPRANSRERLRLDGQAVHINGRAQDHSEILPEFLKLLGYAGHLPRSFRVLDLLRLVPSIHRTFAMVQNCEPNFTPIARTELLHSNSNLWARIHLNIKDKDVASTLPTLRSRQAFASVFHQVESETEGELWFESDFVHGARRGVDTAITTLSQKIRRIGIAPILTSAGYRFYFSSLPPRDFLPYLAATYGVAFYLGSITRYKPDVFGKIISGKHNWAIAEFLATQPLQFLYVLSSELAGVDVVRPYAAVA